jgi:hypothetical protein
MCKEMLVIPVNKVVDPRRIIGKNGGPRGRKRHKGSLTPPPKKKVIFLVIFSAVYAEKIILTLFFKTINC